MYHFGILFLKDGKRQYRQTLSTNPRLSILSMFSIEEWETVKPIRFIR